MLPAITKRQSRLPITQPQYEAQEDMLDDFDFSRIFEDEPPNGLDEIFSSGIMVNHDAKERSKTFPDRIPLPPQVPQDLSPPPVTEGEAFINLYMIVDPKTGQMVCPKQLLTFKNGTSTSTAMFGPSFLRDASNNGGMPRQRKQAQGHLQIPVPPFAPIMPEILKSDVNESFSLQGLFSQGRSSCSTATTGYPAVEYSTDNSATVNANNQQPLRALSAYNFFFQAERDKILKYGCHSSQHHVEDDWSDARKHRILQAHWNRDRTKKRRHRKSHGRISFIQLSKEISSRWKKINDEGKRFYRQVSALDLARFQRETQELSETTTYGQQRCAASTIEG